MNEELLQYIWQAGLFNTENLKTTDNRDVMILKRGKLNRDSGPDFSEARIRIGEADWVGNVEIHIDSNDWFQHKHHLDKAYNNTVLHVVQHYRKPAVREDGTTVPTLVVNTEIYTHVLQNFERLKSSALWIPCEPMFKHTDHFTRTQTLDRVLVNRLERKSRQIEEWLALVKNDWQAVFYYAVSRSFGFGTNTTPFEQLALRLPLNILGKHKSDLHQLEALFFGTAGFLEQDVADDYHGKLKSEWSFLRKKYSLHPLESSSFKLMRMRPGNFPTMRLAQLASLVYRSHHLFSAVLELQNVKDIIDLFKAEASDYWQTHYVFGKTTTRHSAKVSADATELLLINAVVPVLFVHGRVTGNEALCNKALSILQHLSPESNAVIKKWAALGMKAISAADTQALLELKTEYCNRRQCLNCKIGHKLLQTTEAIKF